MTQTQYVNAGVKLRRPVQGYDKYKFVFPSFAALPAKELVYGQHFCHTLEEMQKMYPTIETLLSGKPKWTPPKTIADVSRIRKRKLS